MLVPFVWPLPDVRQIISLVFLAESRVLLDLLIGVYMRMASLLVDLARIGPLAHVERDAVSLVPLTFRRTRLMHMRSHSLGSVVESPHIFLFALNLH